MKNTKVCDLSTKEGLNEYNKILDELKNTDFDLLSAFGIDEISWIDNLREIGEAIYEYNHEDEDDEEEKQESKEFERKEYDHTEDDEDLNDIKESEPEFKRPSELLTISQKLQLHKLVQEYVDTAIKPFNNGILSNDQINDAYAGLYEFAAWILNK